MDKCVCMFVRLVACMTHIVMSGVCATNLHALCDLLTANPAKYIIPLGLSVLLGVRNQYV